jgi:hypothetical protein
MSRKKLLISLAITIISIPMLLSALLPVPVHAVSLTLSPASGSAGATIQINGKGFVGHLATIYWDDIIVATDIPISEAGDLDCNLTVPPAYKGTHVIRITDDSHWSGSIATADFLVVPQITVFPSVSTDYTTVTITGNGFDKGEKGIKIIWDGDVTLTPPITADRFGKWSTIFKIPKASKGEHYFSAFSNMTSASEVGKSEFIIAPYVKANLLSGPVGTQIYIYGWGFRANEDGITITWDDEIIKCNIRAENDGSLIVDEGKMPSNDTTKDEGNTRETVNVPPTTQGQHVIGVYGSSFTPKGTFNDIVFEVIPEINLQPEPSIKGTQITITGTGFASNESITISLGKTATDITVTTDNTGSFNAILTIPTSKGKEYSIAALGNKGNSAQASFISNIDKALPTEIKPLFPVQGARLAMFNSIGEALLGTAKYVTRVFDYLKGSQPKATGSPNFTFAWAVADDSTETNYVLQVSTDPNFSSIILDKTIPNHSEYTPSQNDNMTNGHYWWRVKAVDSVGNESQWSEVSEFEVVSMPTHVSILTWAVLILILAAIVFGILTARANLRR